MNTIQSLTNLTSSCFFHVRRSVRAIVLAGLCLAGAASSSGAKVEFERTKPHVNVGSIGPVELIDPSIQFEFAADLATESFGRASGGMHFLFADGSVRFYQAVVSTIQLEGHQALVFFLLLPSTASGELDPSNPITAVARQVSNTRTPSVFWEIDGSRIRDGTLRFEVPGQMRLIPKRETQPLPPERPWFSLKYPPQRVKIADPSIVASFEASARILRDHAASGLVELGLPDDKVPLRFNPVFGSSVAESETGPGYIILLFVPEEAALRLQNLAIATVRSNPTLPGCDIWDFTSNVGHSSALRVQFDAAGRIRFHGPSTPASEAVPTVSSRSEENLGAPDPDALGPWNLSQATDGDWRANHGKAWVNLRGWNRRAMAANFLVEGDAIPVSVLFSAEARVDDVGKRMFARVLVDGQLMHPGDVVLAAGGSSDRQAAQSFEFSGIYDRGLHTLEVQWLVDEGGSGYIRDAALLIRQGNSSEARPLLVAVTPESGVNVETQSTQWQDVPGLQAGIVIHGDRHGLTATVSAEAYALSGGTAWIRVLVDGAVAEPGPVRFATDGFEGTRTMLFGMNDPGLGNHNVRVQWRASGGGTAGLGDRTLTVQAGGTGNDEPLRQSARFADNEIRPTGSYSTMPDMTQNALILEDSDVAVIFTAEFPEPPTAPVWARLSIGGVPVSESEVLLADTETAAGVHAFVFDAKHVAAENGSLVAPIRIEWRGEGVTGTDPEDARPSIVARSMAVYLRDHVAPDLAEAPRLGLGISFDGVTVDSTGVEPAFGKRPVLVILFDPKRPGHPAPSIAELTQAFFGPSDSIADYYDKVSGGRFTLVNAGVLGPYDAQHPPEYYWSGPGSHQDKWIEAVTAADAEFDFSAYDLDKDGYLSAWDELVVCIVVPQADGAGFTRALWKNALPLTLDNVYVETISEWYTSNPLADYPTECHELGHQILLLGDLYAKTSTAPDIGTRPGVYCLMDQGSYTIAQHLNPAYKLALGWVTPAFVQEDSSVSLPEVKTSREVVVLPRAPGRHADEYIVLENRVSPASNSLYDYGLPESGIAVWQIIESPVDSDNPCVCTTAATWAAQTSGDHTRRAIRLIRPRVNYGSFCSLWSSVPSLGCEAYDLDNSVLVCPDDGPARNALLWSTYQPAYELRNVSAPGPVMTFDIVAP